MHTCIKLGFLLMVLEAQKSVQAQSNRNLRAFLTCDIFSDSDRMLLDDPCKQKQAPNA